MDTVTAGEKTAGFSVGHRTIGPGAPLFFIAEIGINHNKDLNLALNLIDAAAEAGCDAAKFQTFRPQDLYIRGDLAGKYRLMGRDIPIYDLHTELEMPEEWLPKLKAHCEERNIVFFSTVVAPAGVDLLMRTGVPAFKISSYDFNNLPLLRTVASKGLPLILSTGGSTLAEVDETFQLLKESKTPFALMHCVAKYPAPYHCANLAVMDTLRQAFQVPVGFSDNGFADEKGRIDAIRVPLAAAQAGADLFEIHTTLDRSLPGPDHGFAAEPAELKEMIRRMREAREAYIKGRRVPIDPVLQGSPIKRTHPEEEYVRNFVYKCLFTTRPVRTGEKLTAGNVGVLRPGQYRRGLPPKYYDLVIDKATARKDLSAYEPITWESILSSQ
jgi:sialic acid synthase SpsE